MKADKTAGSRARRARARAQQDQDQDRFLRCWFELGSLKKGMAASGVTWHHIQAWRRWDPDFLGFYESFREIVHVERREAFEERIMRRAFAGSRHATDMLIRLFWTNHLCALCRRPIREKES